MKNTKEYLEKLKEEDYIAWADTVNDPMVTRSSTDTVDLFIFLGFAILSIIAGLLIFG